MGTVRDVMLLSRCPGCLGVLVVGEEWKERKECGGAFGAARASKCAGIRGEPQATAVGYGLRGWGRSETVGNVW